MSLLVFSSLNDLSRFLSKNNGVQKVSSYCIIAKSPHIFYVPSAYLLLAAGAYVRRCSFDKLQETFLMLHHMLRDSMNEIFEVFSLLYQSDPLSLDLLYISSI